MRLSLKGTDGTASYLHCVFVNISCFLKKAIVDLTILGSPHNIPEGNGYVYNIA